MIHELITTREAGGTQLDRPNTGCIKLIQLNVNSAERKLMKAKAYVPVHNLQH